MGNAGEQPSSPFLPGAPYGGIAARNRLCSQRKFYNGTIVLGRASVPKKHDAGLPAGLSEEPPLTPLAPARFRNWPETTVPIRQLREKTGKLSAALISFDHES